MKSPDILMPTPPSEYWSETDTGLLVPAALKRQIRAADLFCGCGGFSLGMQAAGINVVAAAEWEPNALLTYLGNLGSVDGCAVSYVAETDRARLFKVLRRARETQTSKWIGRHNPNRDGSGCRAMVMGDASKISGDTIREALAAVGEPPELDVVFGGPPCQGMSRAGKRNPDDPRNNLVLEFIRLADELGVETFVMENVPPLVTEKKYRPLFDTLVERARAAGFGIAANVLDAANYGVPQYRRRAFIVGTRGRAARRPFSFPMPTTWGFVAPVDGPITNFFDRESEVAEGDNAQAELPL